MRVSLNGATPKMGGLKKWKIPIEMDDELHNVTYPPKTVKGEGISSIFLPLNSPKNPLNSPGHSTIEGDKVVPAAVPRSG